MVNLIIFIIAVFIGWGLTRHAFKQGYECGFSDGAKSEFRVNSCPIEIARQFQFYQSAMLVRVPANSSGSYRQFLIDNAKYDVVCKIGECLAAEGILNPKVSEFGSDPGGTTYCIDVELWATDTLEYEKPQVLASGHTPPSCKNHL